MTHHIVQPKDWVKPRGYSNGIIASGKLLFIAGQIGWNPKISNPEFSSKFSEQFETALENVLAVLSEAKGEPQDLVRLTIYVTDKREYLKSLKEIGVAWKRLLGRHYPTMALVQVVALVEDLAKVEIEGTAVLS